MDVCLASTLATIHPSSPLPPTLTLPSTDSRQQDSTGLGVIGGDGGEGKAAKEAENGEKKPLATVVNIRPPSPA